MTPQHIFHIVLTMVLAVNSFMPFAEAKAAPLLGLPKPGMLISLSPAYNPVMIRGVTVHKDNPFLFDFIMDEGESRKEMYTKDKRADILTKENFLKEEYLKLVKYFMAALAVPAKDLWVNLSPYEKGRIVTDSLGQTEMGRDLLAQDYLLKQITASLIYPEKDLGKRFWKKVYQATQVANRSISIPLNIFNKVWIMADKAEVFERGQTAFVTSAHLKVMLEEDYLATTKHQRQPGDTVPVGAAAPTGSVSPSTLPSELPLNVKASQGDHLTQNVIRQIVLPAIEEEVNTGKNFAALRQIFNAIILASWYKNNLKNALLNEVYANKNNVNGIDMADKTIKQQIYDRYLQAYKKGVFNYIKDEDRSLGSAPRKYFSGGVDPAMAFHPTAASWGQMVKTQRSIKDLAMVTVELFSRIKSTGSKRVQLKDELFVMVIVSIVLGALSGVPFFHHLMKINAADIHGPEAVNGMPIVMQTLPVLPRSDGLYQVNLKVGARNLTTSWFRRNSGINDASFVKLNGMAVLMDEFVPLRVILVTAKDDAAIKKGIHWVNTGRANTTYEQAMVSIGGRDFGNRDVLNALNALEEMVNLFSRHPLEGAVPFKYSISSSLGEKNHHGVSEKTIEAMAAILGLVEKNSGIQVLLRDDTSSGEAVMVLDVTISINREEERQAVKALLGEIVKKEHGKLNNALYHRSAKKISGFGSLSDKGMSVEASLDIEKTGGIDLINTKEVTAVSKVGAGVQMHVDPALIARIRRDGIGSLTPHIIGLKPLPSIWPMLNMTQPPDTI